ncbi:MAG: CARDB domain-containing protein [Chloroflexota bacterium]|nr:CARDB domain-containing protein [Chloroflexota bacterium]
MKVSKAIQLAFACLLTALLFTLPSMAQQTPEVDNPDATITWPPPVYTVSGDFTIRGSANLPNMSNYFIEYRLLPEFDPTLDSNAPEVWIPATTPSASAVVDGVLGVWDTTLTDDGVYALRLTVRVRGGQPVTDIVSPIRVLNNPPPFAVGEGPVAQPIATQPAQAAPTAVPTLDVNPRATVTSASANVRTGDSTAYPVVTFVQRGNVLPILGISSMGTGWYYVQLPDGRRGWISPVVVDVEGDFSNVPRLAPPPIPVTATPTLPPATFTPASSVNLVAGIVVFDTPTPTCNTPFTVGFDIANQGSVPSAGGIAQLTDTRAADGSVQLSTTQPLPIINPGTTVRINFPITIGTWYNENHIITLTIDPGNQILEFNEGDNRQTVSYFLAKGACP